MIVRIRMCISKTTENMKAMAEKLFEYVNVEIGLPPLVPPREHKWHVKRPEKGIVNNDLFLENQNSRQSDEWFTPGVPFA
jgi:hypothetical protein